MTESTLASSQAGGVNTMSILSNASSTVSLSRKATKSRIVNLANELLSMCKSNKSERDSMGIPTKITHVRQVNSNLFVLFYEELCNTELVGESRQNL